MSKFEVQMAKQSRTQICEILREAGASVHERKNDMLCPFHNDKNKSANIKAAGATGNWTFYCHACHISEDIVSLLCRVRGITIAEAFQTLGPTAEGDNSATKTMQNKAESTNEKPKPKPTFPSYEALIHDIKSWTCYYGATITENAYTDPATGICEYYVIRIDPREGKKTFLQVRRNADGTWELTRPEGALPLFNRKRMLECDTIIVVEGEKAVRAIVGLQLPGITATTSPMGSGNADKADWSSAAGKNVFIFGDFDESGQKYEKEVLTALRQLNPKPLLSRIEVEKLGLPEGGDVVEFLAAVKGGFKEKQTAFTDLINGATSLRLSGAIRQQYLDTISGKRKVFEFANMPKLSSLTQALRESTVTLLVGSTGAGKTLFLSENILAWLEQGINVKYMVLEEKMVFYQERAMAQIMNDSRLANDEFIKNNPEYPIAALDANEAELERFSECITICSSELITRAEITTWTKKHAEAKGEDKAEIIIIDPISLAKPERDVHIADQLFIMDIKAIAERNNTRIIITSHPRSGKPGAPGLDGMAGGSAYPRACSTMLWLHNLNKETETAVWDMGRISMRKHYLMVQVRKCRSGKGLNSEFAFNVDGKTLRLKEIGMVAPTGQIAEPEYAVKDIVGAKAPAETFESVLHKAHDADAIKAPADAPKTVVSAPVIPGFNKERSFEQNLDIAF